MKFKKEAKIAIVVSLIMFLFLWGFNFLKGKNLFTTFNTYYAVFEKIDGLQKSNTVTINGFAVGIVNDIRFESEKLDKLIVEIGVNKTYKIPANSTMLIASDLLGSKSISLILSNSPIIAENGSMLRDSVGSDIFATITSNLLPIANSADKMLTSVDTLLQAINSTFDLEMQKNIQNIVANIEQMIASERRKIAAIMTNFESVSNNLKNSNDNITSMIANFNEFSENIADADLKSAVDKINGSLAQLQELLSGINSGEGSLGQFVTNDSLYNNLQQFTGSLEKLVVDMRENPKRYVHFSLFGRKN